MADGSGRSTDLLRCPVCMDTFQDPRLLGDCGHTFCARCITGVQPQRCPTCRRPFRTNSILPNFALRALINEAGMARGGDLMPDRMPTTGDQENGTPRQGNWMRDLRARDPADGVKVELLMSLGLPAGLAKLLNQEDKQIALRVFLLDNSGSTSHPDGQVLEEPPNGGSLRFRQCTRWEEITHTALEHARWNLKLGTPIEFVLLNPPSAGDQMEEGVDFQRVDNSNGQGQQQLEALQEMLKRTDPAGATPLTERLQQIRARIMPEGRDLARKGQKVVLVIVTDGLPTSTYSGVSNRHHMQSFVQELRRMSAELPIHLVVRLCTNEDSVVSFYNSVDEEVEIQLEVIDDMRGEAQECRGAGNRFLIYSPIVHRLREGGTFLKLFDLLDERRLEPMEVLLCCQLLLRQKVDDPPLPSEPKEFLRVVRELLPALPQVYCPLRGRMMPPVLMVELEFALKSKSDRRACGECGIPCTQQ